jgi:hypothetical protein
MSTNIYSNKCSSKKEVIKLVLFGVISKSLLNVAGKSEGPITFVVGAVKYELYIIA